MIIILIIAASAVATGYESMQRFMHRSPWSIWGWLRSQPVLASSATKASLSFGFGLVQKLGSAALVADGHHARIDGLVSLAVVLSAMGLWLGYPWADPVVRVRDHRHSGAHRWESGQTVVTRLLDGIEPEQQRHCTNPSQTMRLNTSALGGLDISYRLKRVCSSILICR